MPKNAHSGKILNPDRSVDMEEVLYLNTLKISQNMNGIIDDPITLIPETIKAFSKQGLQDCSGKTNQRYFASKSTEFSYDTI